MKRFPRHERSRTARATALCVAALAITLFPAHGATDGKVAYVKIARVGQHVLTDLKVLNPNNLEGKLLTRTSMAEYDPRWSRDGSRVVFTRGAAWASAIFTVGADGSDLRQVTDFGAKGTPRRTSPCFSPDGTKILFAGVYLEPQLEFTLEVMNADGSERRTIVTDSHGSIRGSWSGDGSQIVYRIDPARRANQVLYRTDLNGSPPEAWISLGSGRLHSFDIQPLQRIDVQFRPLVRQELSAALVEVAVLGSPRFDVRELVASSLRLGPGNAEPAHALDDGFYRNDHLRDLNLDGFVDLVVHFPIRDAGLERGEALELWGETTRGQIVWDSERVPTGRATRVDEASRRLLPPIGRASPGSR